MSEQQQNGGISNLVNGAAGNSGQMQQFVSDSAQRNPVKIGDKHIAHKGSNRPI
jgi:hypothetical protein